MRKMNSKSSILNLSYAIHAVHMIGKMDNLQVLQSLFTSLSDSRNPILTQGRFRIKCTVTIIEKKIFVLNLFNLKSIYQIVVNGGDHFYLPTVGGTGT